MKLEPLKKGYSYHIYNRGNNSDLIFKNEDNYDYFLKLVNKYLTSYITLYAYCLLNNHYHLIVHIEDEGSIVTQKLSNLFNAYAKAFNKAHKRTGSLFEKHFKRIKIRNEGYLKNLIMYTHTNAQHHNVVSNFETYPYSSYTSYINNTGNLYILELFGGKENFEYAHSRKSNQLTEKFTFE